MARPLVVHFTQHLCRVRDPSLPRPTWIQSSSERPTALWDAWGCRLFKRYENAFTTNADELTCKRCVKGVATHDERYRSAVERGDRSWPHPWPTHEQQIRWAWVDCCRLHGIPHPDGEIAALQYDRARRAALMRALDVTAGALFGIDGGDDVIEHLERRLSRLDPADAEQAAPLVDAVHDFADAVDVVRARRREVEEIANRLADRISGLSARELVAVPAALLGGAGLLGATTRGVS